MKRINTRGCKHALATSLAAASDGTPATPRHFFRVQGRVS